MAAPSSTAASFVTEVLATAGRLEKEDLNVKLAKLAKRIDEVKVEVYDSLQQEYDNFYPSLNTAHDLSDRVKSVTDEMHGVSSKIENEIRGQLNRSTTEFQDLSSQLEESTCMLLVLDKLAQIHEAYHTIDKALKNEEYTLAADNMNVIETLLENPVNEREGEIKILNVLQSASCIQKEKLIRDIQESWSKHIKWDLPQERGTTSDTNKSLTVGITIASSGEARKALENCAQAMHNMNLLQTQLKVLGTRLFEHLIKPVVKRNLKVECNIKEDPVRLQIVRKKKQKQEDGLQDIFGKLEIIMQVFSENLLNIEIEEGGSANETKKKVTLMQKVGDLVSDDILDFLLKECLAPSIPSNSKELEKYHQVASTTERFQKTLVSVKFIPVEKKTLIDYVNNVNVLFANKKCQEILQKARNLMTSDLHNTVKVSPEIPHGELPPLGKTDKAKKLKTAEKVTLTNSACLNANTFKLPTCLISYPIQSLMTMVYETLHEATSSSPECAIQLFYAVRNIFEMFCSVVPTYHKEALESLPQLSALHHNNCMYIAHHLLTLGHQFRPKLPTPLVDGAAMFVDFVNKLRRLGTECFLQQMAAQKSQMVDILKGAQGFQNMSEDSNFTATERCLKQVLHQLQHLSNVWRDVLPINIYNKTMGTLLNSLMSEIITSITSLEDISADDASSLHSLLAMVEGKASGYLQPLEGSSEEDVITPAQLSQHIVKWLKYKELMWILNAGLHDIGDRWADGKGPLAAEFKANEVKQLIRALFQNTDRRAAVLGKIR